MLKPQKSQFTFEFIPLGISSATPIANRGLAAHILNHNYKYFLFDCGEGTQMRLQKYQINHQKIETIFVSHSHGDHFFGLIGLLSSMALAGREQELKIFCVSEVKKITEYQLETLGLQAQFPIIFEVLDEINDKQLIYESKHLDFYAFPLNHRVKCYGFQVIEKEKQRKFLPQKARALGIPVEYYRILKQEKSVELLNGEVYYPDQVLGDREKSFSFSFCTDTKFEESTIEYVKNSDLLYHEATFLESHKDLAEKTFHSTAKQAAKVAKEADVGKLVIGHFSARYLKLNQFKEEASELFENTFVAKEGFKFNVIN